MELTIWVTLRTAVSVNIVPASWEDILRVFEEVKEGKRVYDAFGRDVSFDVVEEMMAWFEYGAAKVYIENKVCEFFGKLKGGEARPEDIVMAAAVARLYKLDVDKYAVAKAIWTRNPNPIPTPPKCLK